MPTFDFTLLLPKEVKVTVKESEIGAGESTVPSVYVRISDSDNEVIAGFDYTAVNKQISIEEVFKFLEDDNPEVFKNGQSSTRKLIYEIAKAVNSLISGAGASLESIDKLIS
jgi:hypothetical protein